MKNKSQLENYSDGTFAIAFLFFLFGLIYHLGEVFQISIIFFRFSVLMGVLTLLAIFGDRMNKREEEKNEFS